MTYLIQRLLLLFCLGHFTIAQANKKEGIEYETITHRISIDQKLSKGYSEDITVQGRVSDPSFEEVISFSELRKVDDLKITYLTEKGKEKTLSKNEIMSDDHYGSSFISDIQLIHFTIPRTSRFTYSYTRSSNIIQTLSSLSLHLGQKVKKISYEVVVPDRVRFEFLLPEVIQKYGTFKMDSARIENYTHYTIQYQPDSNLADALEKMRTNYRIKPNLEPGIRICISPTSYPSGASYFNDWYYQLIWDLKIPDDEIKSQIDTLLVGINTDQLKIKKIFDWVKNGINYIDIEVGINAFVPRDASDICRIKKGDCKDMSNLTYQALQYIGIESYLALSASLSHPYDFTFPSLASGNHLICVARLDDEWIFLDATESLCRFPNPSRQIQGKHVMIIGPDSAHFEYVPIVDINNNNVNIQLDLVKDSNHIYGNLEAIFTQLSAMSFEQILSEHHQQDLNEYIGYWIEKNLQKAELKSFSINSGDTLFGLISELEYHPSILTTIGSKSYLELSFVPFPNWHTEPLDSLQKLILYKAESVHFKSRLKTQNEVHLKESKEIEFTEGPFSFIFYVSQIDSTTILIEYALGINLVVINSEKNRLRFNRLNERIVNELKTKVILENL